MGGKPGYGLVEQFDFRYAPIPVLEKVHGHSVHLRLNVNDLTIPAQLACRRVELELAAHVDDRAPRMATPVRSGSSFAGRIVAGEWSRDLHLISKTLTRSARIMTTTFNVAR